MKGKCKTDGTPFCDVHLDFIEAVQDLKTSIRWIVMIGGGILTMCMFLISIQYTQWQSAEAVHAQVQVNQAVLTNHLVDGVRHGL